MLFAVAIVVLKYLVTSSYFILTEVENKNTRTPPIEQDPYTIAREGEVINNSYAIIGALPPSHIVCH